MVYNAKIALGLALAGSIVLAYVVYSRYKKTDGISKKDKGWASRKRGASSSEGPRPITNDQSYDFDPKLDVESQVVKRLRRSDESKSSVSRQVVEHETSLQKVKDVGVVATDVKARPVSKEIIEPDHDSAIGVDEPKSEEEETSVEIHDVQKAEKVTVDTKPVRKDVTIDIPPVLKDGTVDSEPVSKDVDPIRDSAIIHEPKSNKDKAKAVVSNELPPNFDINSPLGALGYYFDGNLEKGEGELKNVETGGKFQFVDQLHYERLGNAVTAELNRIMVEVFKMAEIRVPLNAAGGRTTVVYATAGIRDALFGGGDVGIGKLLILVHGSGAVRAGQWARSLIINNDLKWGSMLPYINDARAAGFEVLITNGNDGTDLRVPENSSPTAHMEYVWKKIVRRLRVERIAFVAHSAGGYVTVKLCHEFLEDFEDHVFAIAFTDSAHGYIPSDIGAYLKDIAQNWVTSASPLGCPLRGGRGGVQEVSAGHVRHEWTSGTAREDVFAYFETKDKKWSDRLLAKKKRKDEEAAAKKKLKEERLAKEAARQEEKQRRAEEAAREAEEEQKRDENNHKLTVEQVESAKDEVEKCNAKVTGKEEIGNAVDEQKREETAEDEVEKEKRGETAEKATKDELEEEKRVETAEKATEDEVEKEKQGETAEEATEGEVEKEKREETAEEAVTEEVEKEKREETIEEDTKDEVEKEKREEDAKRVLFNEDSHSEMAKEKAQEEEVKQKREDEEKAHEEGEDQEKLANGEMENQKTEETILEPGNEIEISQENGSPMSPGTEEEQAESPESGKETEGVEKAQVDEPKEHPARNGDGKDSKVGTDESEEDDFVAVEKPTGNLVGNGNHPEVPQEAKKTQEIIPDGEKHGEL